ncbi:KilA-N domain-containing protein [Brevundimonas sp. SL161]|uniref:KilA-N domain-containing protein n=1 Tax=Brevundimonas sp. SL161 TaxID=2804613 RepID=UPI003CF8DB6B
MTTSQQPRLDLIPHDYRGEIIAQRERDGYINATAMCKAAGKLFGDYQRLKTTVEFMAELSGSMGIPIDGLVSSITTGQNELRGSWVHPQVATHLAQWASPRFAVLVSKWVLEWMTGADRAERAWNIFNERLDLIHDRVPLGYFCVFRETADLYAALIRGGINPGLQILIDISVGKVWARHWRSEKLADRFGRELKFEHYYPDFYRQALSNPQMPNCYPEDALPSFRRWLREVYVPTKMPAYLKRLVADGRIMVEEATAAIASLEQRDRVRSLPLAA